MRLWLEVTQDKYELPLAVATSAVELARLRGVTAHTIWGAMWAQKKRNGKCKYVTVEVDDEKR